MKAEGGTLMLTSTNLEMATSCLVRGKVEKEGDFTVPAKLFFDYVSLLPSEQVDLELVDNTLSVSCGNFSTKINGLPASEFPLIPTISGGVTYSIQAELLRTSISQVLFAVATNEARPELSGVYMKFNDSELGEGKVTLAATDSYRLGEKVVDMGGAKEEGKMIVPSRALAEVARILSVFKDDVEIPESVEITVADNQFVVKYGSVELISRTIEGNYPDYRQIIPSGFKTEATFGVSELIKAIKTASLFSRTGLYDVTLDFLPEKKAIVVKGSDATRGENIATCLSDLTGESNSVTVNFRYLLDGLQALLTEEAVLRMVDGANPCVLSPVNSTTGAYLYIVMPIKQ